MVADEITALASKSYVCRRHNPHQIKLSAKGCNKSVMLESNPVQAFSDVLHTRQSMQTMNRGIRLHGTTVKTYLQQKTAISFCYFKRHVLEDGVYTIPLNIVLNPVPIHFICLQTDCESLSSNYPLMFALSDGVQFITIRQAFVYAIVCFHHSPNISLLTKILNTQKDSHLNQIKTAVLPNDKWEVCKDDILIDIVEQRFQQNVLVMQANLCTDSNMSVANACPYDTYLGIGISPRELRWRPEYNANGRNMLGKIYDHMRECIKGAK